MKFLIITAEYPPICGGAGNFIFDFANGLHNAGHHIELITRKPKISSNSSKTFDVFTTHFVKKIPNLFIYFMWKKVKKIYNNFDYIILNGIGASYIGALFFNEALMIRSILFFHGQEDKVVIEKLDSKFEKFISLKEKYFNLLIKSKNIFAVSEDQKKKIIQSCLPCYDLSNKFNVVYNSYNPEQFHPDNSEFNDFDKKCINFLTVSRIVQEKGFDFKFEVMMRLKSKNQNFKWYIIGDGNYKDDFESKIAKSVIKENVVFLGRKNRDEIKKYYSNADVFILLSLFRESFGLVYLESIACGCPVIGLDNGGVREVIKSGVNGYLIEYNDNEQIINETIDKILLINNDSLDKSKFPQSIEKFKIENNVKKFIKYIKI